MNFLTNINIIEPIQLDKWSSVYKCKYNNTNAIFKICRYSKTKISKLEQFTQFLYQAAEIKLHPDIYQIITELSTEEYIKWFKFQQIQYEIDSKELYMVIIMENIDGLTLGEYYKEYYNLFQNEILNIQTKLYTKLTWMWNKKVLHKDLHQYNILVKLSDEKDVIDIYIIDFELDTWYIEENNKNITDKQRKSDWFCTRCKKDKRIPIDFPCSNI